MLEIYLFTRLSSSSSLFLFYLKQQDLTLNLKWTWRFLILVIIGVLLNLPMCSSVYLMCLHIYAYMFMCVCIQLTHVWFECVCAHLCHSMTLCVYVRIWKSICSTLWLCVCMCVCKRAYLCHTCDCHVCLCEGTFVSQCTWVRMHVSTCVLQCSSVCVYIRLLLCHSVYVEVLGTPPASVFTFHPALPLWNMFLFLLFAGAFGNWLAHQLRGFCPCLSICLRALGFQLAMTWQDSCGFWVFKPNSSPLRITVKFTPWPLSLFRGLAKYILSILWFWKHDKAYIVWGLSNNWRLCLLFKKHIKLS